MYLDSHKSVRQLFKSYDGGLGGMVG